MQSAAAGGPCSHWHFMTHHGLIKFIDEYQLKLECANGSCRTPHFSAGDILLVIQATTVNGSLAAALRDSIDDICGTDNSSMMLIHNSTS